MEPWIEFGIDNYIKTIEDGKLFQGENEAVFKQVFFEEQLKLHKRYKTVKKCSCPNCEKKSIKKSHTVSRKMSLEEIQENKKVVTPAFVEKYPIREEFIEIEYVGIGIATTFPGFCKEHERIFETFERAGTIRNEADIVRQAYRNVVYNCFIQKSLLEQMERSGDHYYEIRDVLAYKYIKKYDRANLLKSIKIVGKDKHIRNIEDFKERQLLFYSQLEYFKEKLWNEIEGRKTDVDFSSVLIDIKIPVCICGCTEIVFQRENYICSVDVIPFANNTLITLGFDKVIPKELKEEIDLKLDNPLAVLNFIEATMIYVTDNWYLKPSVWEKLGSKRQEEILLEMQKIEKSLFNDAPYSVFDDIRVGILNLMFADSDLSKKEWDKMLSC